MSVVLVVAAHPDDEILGVGGTIAKHVAKGDKAYALILGEGETSRWAFRELADADTIKELRKEALEAGKIIGYSQVFFESLPDNRFDSVDLLDVVKCVEKYVKEIKPDIIYTHYDGDLNIDHQITYRAVLTATRPIEGYFVKEIYQFETVSSTEWSFGAGKAFFSPNVFIDIEEHFQKKCEAMKKYQSELCSFPHPRSLKMLECIAQKWGGTVGKQYVEAFELVRKVE